MRKDLKKPLDGPLSLLKIDEWIFLSCVYLSITPCFKGLPVTDCPETPNHIGSSPMDINPIQPFWIESAQSEFTIELLWAGVWCYLDVRDRLGWEWPPLHAIIISIHQVVLPVLIC